MGEYLVFPIKKFYMQADFGDFAKSRETSIIIKLIGVQKKNLC